MLEIILAGGWLMAPILLCSTLAVAIIIERFWTLRRSKVIPKDWVRRLRTGQPSMNWISATWTSCVRNHL